MDAIAYERAPDAAAAIRSASQPGAVFIGGGTNLLDLMKGGVERPVAAGRHHALCRSPDRRPLPDGGLRIGALVRNSDAANHPLVRDRYPLLSQALLAGASPQLRNMATVGGNLMQRTRCYYFYDTGFPAVQQAQSRAAAARRARATTASTRSSARATQCIATNPSDMSVALAALDAVVRVRGPQRRARDRRSPTSIACRATRRSATRPCSRGELIVAVDLPPPPFAQHSHYLKVRDRASYAFALVSVAAALRDATAARCATRAHRARRRRAQAVARDARPSRCSPASRSRAPRCRAPPRCRCATRGRYRDNALQGRAGAARDRARVNRPRAGWRCRMSRRSDSRSTAPTALLKVTGAGALRRRHSRSRGSRTRCSCTSTIASGRDRVDRRERARRRCPACCW